jgi:plasmid stabilization system protein ParE
MATRSRRVVWTAHARRDLDGIIDFVAEDSLAAAHGVLDVVLRTAGSLQELSERGRVVPEFADSSIREVFVYSYRLMYRVLEDEVQILSVVHGARDFGAWIRTRRVEPDS